MPIERIDYDLHATQSSFGKNI